jgi:hypothetical protein
MFKNLLLQASPEMWRSDFSLVTVLGLATIVGIFIAVWYLKTREVNKGLKAGEVINKYFIEERVFIAIAFVIGMNIAEALTAASISHVGEAPFNQVARFLSHMGIAAMGIMCAIYVPILLKDLGVVKDKMSNLFLLIMMIFGSFFFPFINIVLISGSLKVTPLVVAFLRGSSTAWNMLPGIMQVTLGLSASHLFAIFLDGLFILTKHSRLTTEKDKKEEKPKDDKPIDKKVTDKGEEKDKTDFKDGIKFLLNRFGYRDEELDTKLKAANNVINSMASHEQSSLARSVWDLVKKIKQFDSAKGSMDDSTIKEKNSAFKTNIFDLFAASTKSGKGFGMTLKAIKTGN